MVKGELTGSESLYIDGKVEGAINLPGNRVTVGRNGQVAANIVAREIRPFWAKCVATARRAIAWTSGAKAR